MEEKNEMSQAASDEQHLQELRQRINAKAESMISFSQSKKSHWIIIIVGLVLIVVFEVLNFLHYGWDGSRTGCYARVGVVLLVTALLALLCFWTLRHHLAEMKRSTSASLHYQAARRYVDTSQLTAVILLTGIVALIPTIYGEGVRTVVFASCFIFVILIVWRLFKPDLLINKDFYHDVEELGEHR